MGVGNLDEELEEVDLGDGLELDLDDELVQMSGTLGGTVLGNGLDLVADDLVVTYGGTFLVFDLGGAGIG